MRGDSDRFAMRLASRHAFDGSHASCHMQLADLYRPNPGLLRCRSQ